ncbi:MAG: VWA domain-containing protein [Planctomycetes bacterium]|nr:VWA domain-containing protein [Planctomycetota bacterium]
MAPDTNNPSSDVPAQTPPAGNVDGIPCDQREHLVIVLDVSESMGERYDDRMNKLTAAQRAVVTLVVQKAQIDANDLVGLVAFNADARIVLHPCPLATNKRDIIAAVQSLEVGGGTDINKGLKAAGEAHSWHDPNVVRRIHLLTDGHGGHPLKTANDLKNRGVVIDVTGMGENPSDVDEKLLRQVASVIQNEVRYRFVKDSATLVDDASRVADKTATAV